MTTSPAPPTRNPDLDQLFPDDIVAVVDVRYSADDGAPPLPTELAALMSTAVEARRREFSYGRWCSSLALDAIGARSRVVGRGPDRAPAWPTDAIGSISHTTGYAVAVAARHPAGRSLGIDAERRGAVGADVAPHVLTETDEARLSSMDASLRTELITVAFSAKEALFKAQYALTGAWVGFDEVQITSIRSSTSERGGELVLVPTQRCVVRDALNWPITTRWLLVGDLVVVGVSASLHTS